MTAATVSTAVRTEALRKVYRVRAGQRARGPAAGLVDELERQHVAASPTPAVQASLEALRRGDAAVVVAGQQVGLFGGPAFSLYKAATAVALAARLRASGRPAAAVFWIGADDADWDEAGWGALPREDLSLFRERWTSPLPSRAWIGDARLALTPEAETLLAGLPGDVRAPGVPARGGDMDLGDGFAACLLELFGGDGLVPLDARWPEVRAAGEELWRTYLDGHAGYAAGVREQGKALAAAGRPVAIADADSDHGLFVVRDRGRAEIDPATWESEARRALAAEGPAALAPSVLLRAPLQDYLFAPHAQVVGVGEAAYLAQLTPVYEGLGIPEPARVPRLEATFLPAGMVPRDRLGEACADPEAFLTELARDRVPSELARRLGDLRLSTAAGLAELRDGGRAFAKDLDQVADFQ